MNKNVCATLSVWESVLITQMKNADTCEKMFNTALYILIKHWKPGKLLFKQIVSDLLLLYYAATNLYIHKAFTWRHAYDVRRVGV